VFGYVYIYIIMVIVWITVLIFYMSSTIYFSLSILNILFNNFKLLNGMLIFLLYFSLLCHNMDIS